MGRRIATLLFAVSLAVSLAVPSIALAAPLDPPPEDPAPGSAQHPLVDSDGDNLSDGLEVALETAKSSDRIDVIVTFIDQPSAGAAENTLPPQAIKSAGYARHLRW